MGIATTTAGDRTDDRSLDVTDLPAEQVAAYARAQPTERLHLERRGARTYLVASGQRRRDADL
jgi:hypothetical protein